MEIKAGDILFLDTNVLLAATDLSRAHHEACVRLFSAAGSSGVSLGTSGQILREYLVVATRPPKDNGLGLSTDDALANVSQFSRRLGLYEENESVSQTLRRLVQHHGLKGKRIHDANVAATMLSHGIHQLVTDNPDDFQWCPDVQIVSPIQIRLPGVDN